MILCNGMVYYTSLPVGMNIATGMAVILEMSSKINEPLDVSIVICTYNRCELLPGALESVLAQEARGVRYEFIIVDNNSTDRTREVVESFIPRAPVPMRYIFEGRQGRPYALNTGIDAARAPIIALTDDDVRVAKDWVEKIKEVFDRNPEIDLVGGKVLPFWQSEPPTWLTRDHWAPLAIQDYGDEGFYSGIEHPVCLVAANLAVRSAVIEQIGGFDSRFQRIGASSTEDHEWQLRFWRAGKRGMYSPHVVVTAEVQTERLTKAYHRLWYTGHGKSSAMMRLREITSGDGRIADEPRDAVKLFGVAAHTYKALAHASLRWLRAAANGSESSSLKYENEVRELLSYMRHQYEENAAERKHAALIEVACFTKTLVRKKLQGSRIETPGSVGR